MKKKYAFFLMGTEFDPTIHRSVFETDTQITYIYTVHHIQQAIEQAQACAADGVGAIELCGAFEQDGAQKIIDATSGRIAVGYVVHNAEQDSLFHQFFSA